jgi:FtsP/CotA-like multicopper oxidase with cupredoxin domain
LTHRLALPGHPFKVIALDGNAIQTAQPVPVLELGPAERVDAIVEMDHPGVWILGETRDAQRAASMGIVVEHAAEHGPPRWITPSAFTWDYTVFGGSQIASEPDGRFPLVIREAPGHKWTINGKSFPHTNPDGQRERALPFDPRQSDRGSASHTPAPPQVRDYALCGKANVWGL